MTTRQAMTIKDVLENKMPVSVAMRKNGYTKDTANALKIKESQAWKQAVAQYLPDHKLFKAHQDALEANKIHGTTDDYVEIPDHPTRLKAVEMGYKLKGYTYDNVRNDNRIMNISWDSQGYVPPNNTQNLKQTYYSKPKTPKR